MLILSSFKRLVVSSNQERWTVQLPKMEITDYSRLTAYTNLVIPNSNNILKVFYQFRLKQTSLKRMCYKARMVSFSNSFRFKSKKESFFRHPQNFKAFDFLGQTSVLGSQKVLPSFWTIGVNSKNDQIFNCFRHWLFLFLFMKMRTCRIANSSLKLSANDWPGRAEESDRAS